ncbi:MAG: hypothetical protein FD119_500, partial [Stygiobacter sp.]
PVNGRLRRRSGFGPKAAPVSIALAITIRLALKMPG